MPASPWCTVLGETSYVVHGRAQKLSPSQIAAMHLKSGPSNAMQSAWLAQVGPPALLEQKPSPSMVLKQLQVLALPHLTTPGVSHLFAQRQGAAGSPGTLAPPFLRHLHLALHLRLASASRGNKEVTTAPTSAPPTSLSALPLEMVPSSSPLARSSKNCSPIRLSPLVFPPP